MKFPVDLEEKVRQPTRADGKGYPYRLSARDLMANFVFASVDVPAEKPVFPFDIPNGIMVESRVGPGGHQQRQIYAEPFPDDPSQGDLMYFDQTLSRWVKLANPGTGFFVLTHNGDVPSWSATSECV